jgi:membrane protein DedA with SNARE-associated domain
VGSAHIQTFVLAVLHLHLHARGPGIDYLGVLLASIASWAGLPGPGEALLVAAAIAAAHHHLDLTPVIALAWLGATIGGMLGWGVGLRAGRGVLTAPGPLHSVRLALTERGDSFFARYGIVAVLFTPSWVAGIHNMRASRYIPVNAISALAWALAIGLAAYWVGPSVTDVVSDAGLIGWLGIAALAVAVAVVLLRRRLRRTA